MQQPEFLVSIVADPDIVVILAELGVLLAVLIGQRSGDLGIFPVHTHDDERQLDGFLVHGGQRDVVLSEDKLALLYTEVYAVGVAGFGRGHAELYNALLGGRLPVGSLHQRTLPAVDDILFLDSGITIVGKNLYHLRQTLVDILRTAVLRMADDAGTHPLRCITSHQRVAEVLIQLHLQHVRDVVLFAFFVFVIVSVLLLSLFQCPAQPFFAANKHAAYDDGDDIPLAATFFLGVVVLSMMQTETVEFQFQEKMCLCDVAA